MNDVTITIVGASGDLGVRQLLPALYYLFRDKKIVKFALIGAALQIDKEQLLDKVYRSLNIVDEASWAQFKEHVACVSFDINDRLSYEHLHNEIVVAEKNFNLFGNRLLYCAVPSSLYALLTEHALASGIIQYQAARDARPWHRIVYEKPFGHNTESAHQLNQFLHSFINECQIFRIDHFLAKELISNIVLFRFTNRIIEPLWNGQHVERVEIVLQEDFGIGARGTYYDKTGALADVVQNHLMQVLALISMEMPASLTGEPIRNAKAAVLEKVIFLDGILGQYEGYQQERDVAADSTTETYAKLRFSVNTDRWRGTTFLVETGKFLHDTQMFIRLVFRPVVCLLAKECPSEPNSLTIALKPQSFFDLRVNVKTQGIFDQVCPVSFKYCYECVEPRVPLPYEIIFEEVLKDDQTISVRFDEIERAWRIIDHIRLSALPLYVYEKNSRGPDVKDMK